jgi:hypothetical protein
MAINFVGQAANALFATSCAVNRATAAGNLLVLMVGHTSRTGVVTLVDSAGGSLSAGDWILAATTNGTAATSEKLISVYYRLNAPAVTSVTVTEASSTALDLNLSEWSGVASFRGAAATTGPTTTVAGVITNDLIVSMIGYYDAPSTIGVSTSGYTMLTPAKVSTSGAAYTWAKATTTATQGPTWTQSPAASWGTVTAAFAPVVVNNPPTVTVTTTEGYQLAGTAFGLSATIVDDTSVTSSQWSYRDDDDDGNFTGSFTNLTTTTPGSGSPSATSTASDANPPAGVRQYRCVGTDGTGLTDTKYVLGYFYPASGSNIPVRYVVPGTYINSGPTPAANMKQAMNDTTPTSGYESWAESISGPVGEVFVLVYEPHGPGDITVWVDLATRDSTPAVPALLTPRKADDSAPLDAAQTKNPTTAPTPYSFVFTPTGNSAATSADRKALRMTVSATTT